jgi:hypothetical protein
LNIGINPEMRNLIVAETPEGGRHTLRLVSHTIA